MSSLSFFEEEISSLASQLQKLLKVIRHSDPSAEDLKHMLHQKYKSQLSHVASQIKERFLWEDLRAYLTNHSILYQKNEFGENQAAIRNKLINDFEQQFVARQVLNEFSPPDPKAIRRQREVRKRRKELKEKRAAAEKKFSKEQIMEMVQTTRQQRQARTELNSLIEAIRKIDPQKIENKINQSIKTSNH